MGVTSIGSETTAAVKLAEAAARASTLQRQLETERAHAAAAASSLQEEISTLKVSAPQEVTPQGGDVHVDDAEGATLVWLRILRWLAWVLQCGS